MACKRVKISDVRLERKLVHGCRHCAGNRSECSKCGTQICLSSANINRTRQLTSIDVSLVLARTAKFVAVRYLRKAIRVLTQSAIH